MPCVYSIQYIINQAVQAFINQAVQLQAFINQAVQVQAIPKPNTHLAKLINPRLHQLGLHRLVLAPALRVHVLLQVHRQKLEYQVQLGLLALMVKRRKRPPKKHLHQNILQVYYVGVLQLPQQSYFSYCSRGNLKIRLVNSIKLNVFHPTYPFILRLEFDLLHCHNFTGFLVLSLNLSLKMFEGQ